MENEVIDEAEDSGSTEALAEEYIKKRRNRPDDVIAMQAVVCILAAAALLIGNIFYPDITGAVFGRLRGLAAGQGDIMQNPIDAVTAYIDKLQD